jgi:hypothetical protein
MIELVLIIRDSRLEDDEAHYFNSTDGLEEYLEKIKNLNYDYLNILFYIDDELNYKMSSDYCKRYLRNKKEEIKKSNENNDNFDEYGFCKDCGWNSCYEDSHIHYGNTGCKYITSKYKISLNEDGEIEYEEL